MISSKSPLPLLLPVLLFFQASPASAADGTRDAELALRVKEAYKEAWKTKHDSLASSLSYQKVMALEAKRFAEVLSDLSDEEKLRGMLAQLYESDERLRARGKSLPEYTPGPTCAMIASNPDLITDPSPLKRMLAEENDPRKFFLQARLSMSLTRHHKTDFVPELSRMLFREDCCTQINYTSKVDVPVSCEAYRAIVYNLKKLGADFREPEYGKGITEAERHRILAAWLRENWPGCENLGVADKSAPDAPRSENHSRSRPTDGETPTGAPLPPSDAPSPLSAWPIVASALLVLAAALGAWLKFRPSNP